MDIYRAGSAQRRPSCRGGTPLEGPSLASERPAARAVRLWLSVLVGLGVGCGADPAPPSASLGGPGPRAESVQLVADTDCATPLVRYADADGDGAGDPAVEISTCVELDGFVATATDCDDLRPDISPAAEEVCGDALDNDCDGGDLACAPPDLATDAVALGRPLTDDEFGFTVVGGLSTPTDGELAAVFGAPAAESFGGAEDDAGLLLQLSGLELDGGGDELAFADRTTGVLEGVPDARLGRALARSSTVGDGVYDRLYVGTGGTLTLGGDDVACAVAWFDLGLPVSGDIATDADGFLTCGAADPSFSYNGVESIAVGFWDDTGEVLAAPRISEDYIYIVPVPAESTDDTLAGSGLRLNDVDEENLGEGLAWIDLDSDGLDDLVVGTPGRSQLVADGGGFDVVMGADLMSYPAGSEYDVRSTGLGVALDRADQNFGFSVTAGDLTGDGRPEVIVGGFEEDGLSPASVVVVDLGSVDDFGGARLGIDALPASASWTRLSAGQTGDLFGYALEWLPNGGLVVGAAGWDAAADPSALDGRIYAFAPDPGWLDSTDHAADTAATATIDADTAGDGLGIGLADAGDVDGDGASDLWLTAFGITTGEARALLLLRTGL